ncbi:MAG: type II toxin-antitoxin system HicB family antitoxin [bacterium]
MPQHEYTVIIEPAEEGGYLARVPALDYLTTEGDTREETKAMAEDAIRGYLELLKAENLPIPKDFFKEQPQVHRLMISI